jgi:DHA2 family multidrug resistance protein-like MFS transporter
MNTSATHAPTAGRREWLGLGMLALANMLSSMDLTVLFLALPKISADLHPSSTELLWITDSYGFLVAGSLLTMGTLGDRIGRRKLLLRGAAAFGALSVLAAFSTSPPMLIAIRGLLGIAGATLAPATLSLVTTMFTDDKQRTAAIGVWGSSFAFGAAVGPLIGGALLQSFWWGSAFLLAVPAMALLLIAGPRLLPEYRNADAGRLDLLSAGESLVAVLAAVYGLKEIARHGIGGAPVAALALGVLVAAAFVARQRRLRHPLLDLAALRARVFATALATNTLATLLSFGLFFLTSQYLQLVLGLGQLEAGLWTIPSMLAVIVSGMTIAPALIKRLRPHTVVAMGLAAAAAGALIISQVHADNGLAWFVVGSTVLNAGIGTVFAVTLELVVSAAPTEHSGATSGLAETGTELGGALGIALLGSLAAAIYRLDMTDAPARVRDTLGAASDAAPPVPQPVLDAAHAAFTHGLSVAAILAATLLAASAIVTARLLRQPATPTAEPPVEPATAITAPAIARS